MRNNENITLKVEGMSCASCAVTITKTLEKKSYKNVNVNFATGEASFILHDKKKLEPAIDAINSLGYKVIRNLSEGEFEHHHDGENISTIEKKFYFTLPFTIPLFLHMFLPIKFLHDPIVQLILCVPVMLIGIFHFGRSAFGSVKIFTPNMDVLIFIGSTSAFIYSLIGMLKFYGTSEMNNYLYFETAATIITLVLLGNVLEHRSIKQTTTSIRELSEFQKVKAKKVDKRGGNEHISEIDANEVFVGNVLQVNDGDKIPVDGELIVGSASVDESMISGEGVPVEKNVGDKLIGGTIVVNGSLRMKAESVGKNTVLSKIIELVKNAQQSKPEIQKLGDKVSTIFVPTVLLISLATFTLSYFAFEINGAKALMNSIAVLVISCPCAMGLATPTAVMVGIGRAAKNGILIKGGSTLEQFANIKSIVFDKTGTLTTGDFKIKKIECMNGTDEKTVKEILLTLEQHSSHPIAKSIVENLKGSNSAKIISEIKEEKGFGIAAKDAEGNIWKAGSWKIASSLTSDNTHTIYLVKNSSLAAMIDLEDNLKEDVKVTISKLISAGIQPVILSGDSAKKCEELGAKIGVEKIYSEQSPAQKLEMIDKFVNENPTAMVGDGINDAPALAKATVGISLSNATQIAIQSAQIILLNGKNLSQLFTAHQISKHTLITIKQNLFWAFFYNIIAIPIAAFGFLSPTIGALTMAFSDVIVIGNSIRLKKKKID